MSEAASGEDLADLELGADAMRELGSKVLERCIDHVARLGETASCGDVHDIEAIRSARLALPEIGMPIEAVRVLRGESSNNVPGASTCLLAGGPGGGAFRRGGGHGLSCFGARLGPELSVR